MIEELKRLIVDLKFEIERGNNGKGKEYCKNAHKIVMAAKDYCGLTNAEIAHVTNADRRTISGWERNGYGDPKMVRLLYDHLKNLVNQPVPPAGIYSVEGDAWREKRGGFISVGDFDEQGQKETTTVRLADGDYQRIQQVASSKGVSTAALIRQSVKTIIEQESGV
jgi:hypothetical protein